MFIVLLTIPYLPTVENAMSPSWMILVTILGTLYYLVNDELCITIGWRCNCEIRAALKCFSRAIEYRTSVDERLLWQLNLEGIVQQHVVLPSPVISTSSTTMCADVNVRMADHGVLPDVVLCRAPRFLLLTTNYILIGLSPRPLVLDVNAIALMTFVSCGENVCSVSCPKTPSAVGDFCIEFIDFFYW